MTFTFTVPSLQSLILKTQIRLSYPAEYLALNLAKNPQIKAAQIRLNRNELIRKLGEEWV